MSDARPALLAGLVALWAGGAGAGVVFDPAATEACLARHGWSEAAEDCAGLAAERCMDDTPGGQTTAGMVQCLDAEARWWEGRLARALSARAEADRRTDAEMRALGSAVAPLLPALQATDAAWRAHRAALCAYEAAQWMGGTGAGPAALACHIDETARRVRALERPFGE